MESNVKNSTNSSSVARRFILHPPIQLKLMITTYQIKKKMKIEVIWLRLLLILALAAALGSCLSLYPFRSFTNEMPSNRYESTYVTETDRVRLVGTWTGLGTPNLVVHTNVNGVIQQYSPPADPIKTMASNSGSYETTAGFNGKFILYVEFTQGISEYSFQFYINGVLSRFENGITLSYKRVPINKFIVTNPCKLLLTVGGLSSQKIGVYQEVITFALNIKRLLQGNTIFPIYQQTGNSVEMVITKPGTYFVVVLPSTETLPLDSSISPLTGEPVPFSITLQTPCDAYCVNPSTPNFRPACQMCGNAILEEGEECDNGNNPGCNGCFVVQGYACYGNPGSSSLCIKNAVCGDGVLDKGEQCDNGNRAGCSTNCLLDAGYKCSTSVGSSSVCGFCGNGVVEPGEECDNKNGPGCSNGCKIDVGFDCRGSSSFCTRKNPSCGNGVIEVAESCDDGNRVNGDGCSQYCFVERDYTCSGEFGETSKCQKTITRNQVCGDGVVEGGEQCDNRNQVGCSKCKVQPGFDCTNQQGSPSVCVPRVVIRNCGNGFFEQERGEACDDGNVASGDGCSSFCQVEPGWICVGNTVCVKLDDERVKLFCGNGKVEREYGEVCDDGNSVSGDGCSQNCKVENGWACRILSKMQNRSYCVSVVGVSYCGNGIVEGNETCDDGFPLLPNDGCSTSCQIEPGWNCEGTRCVRK